MLSHQKQPWPPTEAHWCFSGPSAKSHCHGSAVEETKILQGKPLSPTLPSENPAHSQAATRDCCCVSAPH